RRRSPEDRYRDLQRGFVFVNFFNLAGETLERTRLDANGLARGVRKLRLGLLFGRGLLIQDLVYFFLSKWRRCLAADKSSYFGSRANRVKHVVGDVPALIAINLDQNIARIKHPRRLDSLVSAHLNDSLSRHQHFRDRAFQIGARNASL